MKDKWRRKIGKKNSQKFSKINVRHLTADLRRLENIKMKKHPTQAQAHTRAYIHTHSEISYPNCWKERFPQLLSKQYILIVLFLSFVYTVNFESSKRHWSDIDFKGEKTKVHLRSWLAQIENGFDILRLICS